METIAQCVAVVSTSPRILILWANLSIYRLGVSADLNPELEKAGILQLRCLGAYFQRRCQTAALGFAVTSLLFGIRAVLCDASAESTTYNRCQATPSHNPVVSQRIEVHPNLGVGLLWLLGYTISSGLS